MYLEATTLQHKVRTVNKYFQHRALIPNVSGMHGFCIIAPSLLLLIFIFKPNCRYLLEISIYTENLYKS